MPANPVTRNTRSVSSPRYLMRERNPMFGCVAIRANVLYAASPLPQGNRRSRQGRDQFGLYNVSGANRVPVFWSRSMRRWRFSAQYRSSASTGSPELSPSMPARFHNLLGSALRAAKLLLARGVVAAGVRLALDELFEFWNEVDVHGVIFRNGQAYTLRIGVARANG